MYEKVNKKLKNTKIGRGEMATFAHILSCVLPVTSAVCTVNKFADMHYI